MGIDLASRPVAEEEVAVHKLATRAQLGDKQAQLALGIRFEEGRGVARDPKRARKLYRLAATSSGGTLWIYSPPVGSAAGRVIPVDNGPRREGLAEARARLERLDRMAQAAE